MNQQIQLLSVGSGGSGLLLQDTLKDLSTPSTVIIITKEEYSTDGFKVNFNGLIGLIKSKNILYLYGQLTTVIQVPKCIHLQKVITFSCGWQHALILSENNLYGIGSNKFYEFGHSEKEIFEEPQVLDVNSSNIIDISCGFRQSFIIQKDDILVVGQNKNNELWLENPKVIQKFTLVQLANVKKIKSGQKFTLALTNDSSLYGWGSNTFGQLASPKEQQIIQQKLLMKNVTHFDCGWSHQIVLTQDGKIYSCGRGDFGQQGDNLKQHHDQYKIIDISGTNVKCGSESTIIINKHSQDIYVTGWNEHGNLGLGHKDNIYKYEKLSGFTKVKAKGASMLLYQ